MRSSFVIFIATLVAVEPASAGFFDRSERRREKAEKVQQVMDAMPELGSLAVRSYQIQQMCRAKGRQSSQDWADDPSNQIALDAMQCCVTVSQTAFAHAGGIFSKFIDPFRSPARNFNKSYEQYAKMAEKIASKAVDQSADGLVDQIVAQTKHDWETTWTICRRPLDAFIRSQESN